jgi:tetratricopeptide (TPR) repeat protein
MKRLLVALFSISIAFAAWALPSLDAVQAEVGKGNYAQAEQMMREVVAAKPNSARAHYVYAEILAHDRRFDEAAEQARRAREIDPALSFTQPDKFRAFAALLEREQAAARRAATASAERAAAPVLRQAAPAPAPAPAGGVPGWIWIVGLGIAGFIAWRLFAARQPAPYAGAMAPAAAGTGSAPAYGPGYGATGYGAAPGYGQPGMQPGMQPRAGNGLLGTGLAVAGGVAAGMLAEKLFEGHRETGAGAAAAAGAGGLVPGMFDDAPADNAAARELEQRPIDFGSGDGWGGGDPGSDAGGGSSGDDGGW